MTVSSGRAATPTAHESSSQLALASSGTPTRILAPERDGDGANVEEEVEEEEEDSSIESIWIWIERERE